MTIPPKPLGLVKMLVESLGLEVTYCYDDLVFISHNAFLFRFPEKSDQLVLHFNLECDQEARRDLEIRIRQAAAPHGLTIVREGDFDMTADEDGQTVSLAFV